MDEVKEIGCWWISVEDSQPEDQYVDVLICGPEEFGDGRVMWVECYAYAPHTTTHWMPLPELPKE